MRELMGELKTFRDDRDWCRVHDARSLSAALAVEAAELQELFLWLSDHDADVRASDRDVRDEVADVLIYALQFCLRFNLDPEEIVRAKMAKNAEKYPVR